LKKPDVILTEYERYLRASGWSPDTVRLRMNLATRCFADYGLEIDRVDVETILSEPTIRGKPPSMWTQATYFSCIRSWCKFLTSVGYIDEDPTEDMPRPRGSKDLPRPLTDAQVERVKAGATGLLYDWVILMLATGMRVHEVAKIRGEDVQPDYIHVIGKGRKPAHIPTHEAVWEMSRRYPTNGFWFPGGDHGHVGSRHITNEMTALFKSLGIEGSSHRLRHTFATRMLKDGHNLRVVQRAMRHESLATTQIYTAVLDDELVSAVTGMRI
jgi:site-specific recombinase XerD